MPHAMVVVRHIESRLAREKIANIRPAPQTPGIEWNKCSSLSISTFYSHIRHEAGDA